MEEQEEEWGTSINKEMEIDMMEEWNGVRD